MNKKTLRLLSAAALCLSASMADAQAPWPARPIRVVVPFPPGGIVDTVARQLQPRLQQALGQTLLIDNKGGAGGSLGASEVARAPADGYTLLMVFDSYATYPMVYPKLGFDITRDLAPVSQIVSNPLVLVTNPALPTSDLKGLVALARSKPGRLNFASVGAGSSNHLTAEYFKSVSNTFITHIPYRGGGPAQQDLMGGQVDMMFLSAVLAQPFVKAGKMQALAQTGAKRVQAFADVPTVSESGYPGFEVNSWVGMLVPAGTPKPIIERLHSEIAKILNTPDFAAQLNAQGLKGIGSSPAEFALTLKSEQAKWTKLVQERKLSLE